MTPPISLFLQIALILIPIVSFSGIIGRIESTSGRIAYGIALALAMGAVAYYLGTYQGWRPLISARSRMPLSPIANAAIVSTALLASFVFIVWRRRKKP